MTHTSFPAPIRVLRAAATVQVALLAGAALLWVVLIGNDIYVEFTPQAADEYYPRGLGEIIFAALTALALGALWLVAYPARRLRSPRRHALLWLVIGEVVTLAQSAVVTGSVLGFHYYGFATWVLVAYDAAATVAVICLLPPATWRWRSEEKTHLRAASS